VKLRIDYSPSLYISSKKVTNITSLLGDYLEEKTFDSINDAREYVKRFSEIENGPKVYGQTRYEYAFIADQHKKNVDYDTEKVFVGVIDIEVGSENGFPDPYEANEPITAITIKYFGDPKPYVFGCGDYKAKENELYVKCKDEWTLCKKFIQLWELKCPDIITGWNTKFFDIPYLVNRFRRIVGEDETKKLSPWNYIGERTINSANGRKLTSYDLMGVASLDYIELYKWYAPGGKSQESYKLDSIANVELGESKLSYDEYDSLNALYRLNFQKFIEYNIKDVELIFKLEDKLKLIELAITLAYDTKSNFEDVFAQTRMWDAMTYSYLLEKNIIVPPREVKDKDSAFEGAYVKEPVPGMYDWVASFDLNSLYPNLMRQYNISPETIVDKREIYDRIEFLESLL
jgi:DNA polymerase elongation subunit (family B)